jgi:hypothetical protein
VLEVPVLLALLAGELTIRLLPFLEQFFPLAEDGGHQHAFLVGLALSPVYGSVAAAAWTITGRRSVLATALRGVFVALAALIPLMVIGEVAVMALFLAHLPILWPASRLICTDYPGYPEAFEACEKSLLAGAILLDGFVIGLLVGIHRKRSVCSLAADPPG